MSSFRQASRRADYCAHNNTNSSGDPGASVRRRDRHARVGWTWRRQPGYGPARAVSVAAVVAEPLPLLAAVPLASSLSRMTGTAPVILVVVNGRGPAWPLSECGPQWRAADPPK